MRRAIRHTLAAVLLATAAAASAPVSGEPELEGVYAAAGVNPDGSEYRGKRLAGRWTVVGNGGAVHTETLTRLAGAAPQPVEGDPPPPPRRPNPAGKSLSL